MKFPRPRPTTVNLVVNRLTFLGTVCAGLGAYLILRGYSQGELLVGVAIGVGGNLGSILARPGMPDKPQDVIVKNDEKKGEQIPVENIPQEPLNEN